MDTIIHSAEVKNGLAKLGVENLRSQQEAPLEEILAGRDAIVLMPTSGGKSLLYQLPAVMDSGHCITIVISPLKALQTDQVTALTAKGIRAAVLNSDLPGAERKAVLGDMIEHGGLLYLAPEQLQNTEVAANLRRANIARVAVDEAHILPQTKDDFRKAYGEIGDFLDSLPRRPQVIALTATATRADMRRIRKSLGIPDAQLFRTPMRRENLRLYMKRIDAAKGKRGKNKPPAETILFQMVEQELERWNGKGAVIIYCPTVKRVKRLKRWLKARGFKVGKYHGKMEAQEAPEGTAGVHVGGQAHHGRDQRLRTRHRQAGCTAYHPCRSAALNGRVCAGNRPSRP